MKRIVLLLTAIILGGSIFTTAKSQTADSATVYVYRKGQFSGATANWAVFLNGEKVCKLSNNKYIILKVAPGKHKISSKIGGVEVFKKETEIEIEATAGGSFYVACNIKSSVMRSRLELTEVTKSTATKQMEGMSVDNCQTGASE
jgi:hypothetical protein